MLVPHRFAPILFGALLSAIMVAVVSAFVLAITQGLHQGFGWQWLRSCVTTWFTSLDRGTMREAASGTRPPARDSARTSRP